MKTKKQQHIKIFTKADERVYQIIATTGGCTAEDAKKLRMNERRLNQHIKQGNLKKDIQIIMIGKNQPPQYLYTFTEKGKKFCKAFCNCDKLYKRAGVKHDMALRKVMIEEIMREDIN